VLDTKEYRDSAEAQAPSNDEFSDLRRACADAGRLLLSRHQRNDGAPVRSSFAVLPSRTPRQSERVPTAATLLRGGRGGEVKLKVELSALWIAVAEPYDVRLPGWAWAKLIGLPDPKGKGARRVHAALRQLAKLHLIESPGGRGSVGQLTLLEETRTGKAYLPPGERIDALRQNNQDYSEHVYFKVPNELWTNGWLAALNGRSLAMLLVLLQQTSGPGRADREVWFSPRVAETRLRLSEDTRKAGIDDLKDLGLVSVQRRPVTPDFLSPTRARNTYTLHLDRLRQAGPQRPPRSVPGDERKTPAATVDRQ